MKRTYNYLKQIIILSFVILSGCTGESNKTSQDNKSVTDTTGVQEEMTVRDTIEDALNEAMTRLHYGDKSGLYENEFSYLTDTTTFDDYLKTGQMIYAEAESLAYLEIVDFTLFDHDSAEANLTVHFKGVTGEEHQLPDQKVVIYYHKGRWIKPTISVIKHQLEYEDLVRKADSAAEAEAREGY